MVFFVMISNALTQQKGLAHADVHLFTEKEERPQQIHSYNTDGTNQNCFI